MSEKGSQILDISAITEPPSQVQFDRKFSALVASSLEAFKSSKEGCLGQPSLLAVGHLVSSKTPQSP